MTIVIFFFDPYHRLSKQGLLLLKEKLLSLRNSLYVITVVKFVKR